MALGPQRAKEVLQEFSQEATVVSALDDAHLATLRRLAMDLDQLEFMPFGQILTTTLRVNGVAAPRLARRGEIQAIIQHVCAGLASGSDLAKAGRFPGVIRGIESAWRELRHVGLGPDDLEKAGLGELAAILREAQDWCAQLSLGDSNTLLRLLADTTLERLTFDRFALFVGDAYRPDIVPFLEQIAAFGAEVTLLVDAAPELFEMPRRVFPAEPPVTAGWADSLFLDDAPEAETPSITVLDVSDPLAEVEWALRRCVELRTQGVLESRMAVYAPDPALYVPLLKASADRFALPIDARVRVPLLTNGFARMISLVVSALGADDARHLPVALDSTYVRADRIDRRELEALVRQAVRLPIGSWTELKEFTEQDPEKLTFLTEILAWREDAASEPRALGVWSSLLHRLTTLEAWQTVDEESERGGDGERDRYAQTALIRAIKDHAAVLDHQESERFTLRQFSLLAQELWEREDMTLPGSRTGLWVTSNPLELGDMDVVVALSMTEGRLPRRRSEHPILGDEARAALAAVRPDLPPLLTSFDEARSQRDTFVRICAAARDHLVLTAARSREQSDQKMSAYLRRLIRIYGERIHSETIPVGRLVPLAENCRILADLQLSESLAGPRKETPPPTLQREEIRDKIRPEFEEKGISIGMLAMASECPFRALAQYRLRLDAGGDGTGLFRLRMLPEQVKLPQIASRDEAELALQQAVADLAVELSTELDDAELTILHAVGERCTEEWLDREFDARALWNIDPELVQKADLSQEPFFATHRVDGVRVKLNGGFAGASRHEDSWILHQYRSSAPREINAERDRAGFLQNVLPLLLLCRTPNPMLMVDGMNGERVLICLKRPAGMRANSSQGFRIISLDVEDHTRFFSQTVAAMAKLAVSALNRADMTALPGEHCQTCAFGELCRVSSVFGEDSGLPGEDAE